MKAMILRAQFLDIRQNVHSDDWTFPAAYCGTEIPNTTAKRLDETLLPTPSCPNSTLSHCRVTANHLITRATKRFFFNDNDLYDLSLASIPHRAAPSHATWAGRLSPSPAAAAHTKYQPNAMAAQIRHRLFLSIACPTRPTPSAISPFHLHLYHYRQYQQLTTSVPERRHLINGEAPSLHAFFSSSLLSFLPCLPC
jgi:hypothetical protein